LEGQINYRVSQFIRASHAVIEGVEIQPGRYPEDSRNTMTEMFFKRYPKATHLFWLDADTVPPPFAIERLAAHNRSVVAGLTPIFKEEDKTKWLWSVRLKNDDGVYIIPIYADLPAGLFRIESSGGTTMLIQRKVIEQLARMDCPIFWTERDPETGKILLSEDFYFTDRIKELGYEIYADPQVICCHYQTKDLLSLYLGMADMINKVGWDKVRKNVMPLIQRTQQV